MSYLIDGKEYSLEDVIQLTKERDGLRIELDKLRCAHGNVCDNAAITEKERDQLAAKCASQHQMLRAFRYSMDTDKPFPSLEKLNAIIADFDQCGQGWLSPEKKKVLVEALEFYSNEWNSDGGKVAKQALE